MSSHLPTLAATDLPEARAVHPHAASASAARRGLARVWHQLVQEWRFQRGLVLLEWLLLAAACWETLGDKPERAVLPAYVPALLALIIMTRSVRADAPASTDAASHTRPLGRAAVWAGKVSFFTLALLLPWVLHELPQHAGYGFGAVEWLGLMLQSLVPAALLGALGAGFISLAATPRQHLVLSFVVLLLAFGLQQVLEDHEWGAERRCGTAVAGVLLMVALLAAWWWQGVRLRPRVAWLCLATGFVSACVLPLMWPWNWRALPPLRYADAKLALHIGTVPEGGSQMLWPALHLRGLPPDEVAAVIAFAPVPEEGAGWPPPKVISSDYTWIDVKTGGEEYNWRWMTQDHTAALVPHYPPHRLWHGNAVDRVRGPELKKILEYTLKTDPAAAQKPWRLRLAVQRLHRVFAAPLDEAVRGTHSLAPQPGHRLDFRLGALDQQQNGGELEFKAVLRRRFPLLVPDGRHAQIRPMGYLPLQNFIAVLHSPALGEVRVAHEDSAQFNYRDTLLLSRHDRPTAFAFPHPGPQMEIEGLTLEQWVAGSTLDIWWPEDRGTLDLEISPADLRRLLEAP